MACPLYTYLYIVVFFRNLKIIQINVKSLGKVDYGLCVHMSVRLKHLETLNVHYILLYFHILGAHPYIEDTLL